MGRNELRIAVVSPFLDRSHGTERCVVEQVERFLRNPGCEVHIYAQSIDDLDVMRWKGPSTASQVAGKAIWHRIPQLPGPHLVNYLWWFVANTTLRRIHRTFGALQYDVIFSPGINCSDADAIAVHVVFQELSRRVSQDLRFRTASLDGWPTILHRRLYYRLIMTLEKRIYGNPRVHLAAVSRLTANELAQHFGRKDVAVIPNAVDLTRFNPGERMRRREKSRLELGFTEREFMLLLIGNGWKNKGLRTVLSAIALSRELPLRLVVVGRDDRFPSFEQIQQLGLEKRVQFIESTPDIAKFYAAADLYAGPSLHDSFALPPLEAMACGLPVITSIRNGGSEIIRDGVNGFVLEDPEDSIRLAGLIQTLYKDPAICRSIGMKAATKAGSCTWEKNASDMFTFLLAARRAREDEEPVINVKS